MKHIPLFFFILIFFSSNTLADQQAQDHDERVQEMVQEGYQLIDNLFKHARASVEARKDLMDAQWLSKQTEIKDLRNLLSNARITSFDENSKNPIPDMLSQYVQQKVNQEIPHIFDIDGVSIKRVEDFYQFAHTLCKLSGGSHCGRMIRAIESDNFENMLKLKLQKAVRKQLRKEIAQQLRDSIIFGVRQ